MIAFLKDSLFHFAKPELNKISKFRNIHKGQECYIFGDGISIKYFDLKSFADKISLVGNYIPFHNDFNKLNAPYCIMSAPFYFSPFFGYPDPNWKKHLYYMSKLYRDVINKHPNKNFFLSLSNYPFVRGKNIFYNFQKYITDPATGTFISDRIDCYKGVLRHAVSMAIYMGFDHIYLVGCDYTFTPTQHLHWYESGNGVLDDMPDYEKDFFNVAKEYIDITTVTLKGKSNILDYISYEELTGNKLNFKENTEIINEKHLNGLRTWSGYKII